MKLLHALAPIAAAGAALFLLDCLGVAAGSALLGAAGVAVAIHIARKEPRS